MASRLDILLVFLVCFLLLSHGEIESTSESSRKLEELQFEQQLTNLRKSAIKSIHEGGDIYDCIDFYKQPGFNHPFWKNTTLEMKRRLFIKAMKTKVNLLLGIGLKDGGCPYGTVPIMRIDEDDLARAKMNSKIYLSNINEEPGHHYAILLTKPDPTRKINGIQASFDAVNTKGVDGSQYSSFRMMLSNGPDSIKTGLTVNPALFKDNKTRLFTHVVMDGRTQCFNQQCPGYIQLNSQIPLGWPVDNTSTIGGDQYAVKLQVIKEYISTGPNSKQFVWTLRFELENTILGFWPTTIFSRLSEFGNQVDWGGEVYSPLDQPSPAMGTGIPPRKNKVDTAYSTFSWFVAVSYQDSQSIIFENPRNTEVYESDPEAYSIVDVGNIDKFYGYLIVYDGPGGIIKSH